MTQRTPVLKSAKDKSAEMLVAKREVVPERDASSPRAESKTQWLRESLLRPDDLAVGASFRRQELLVNADVFDLGIDASESISAGNSIEKMLAHQMAAAHDLAMKLCYLAMKSDIGPLNVPKLTNAAVRLMEVYQSGVLALHKVKTGGRQTVVVQHVDVSAGGQAVITGSMAPGSESSQGEGSCEE